MHGRSRGRGGANTSGPGIVQPSAVASKRARAVLWVFGLLAAGALVFTASLGFAVYRTVVSTPTALPAATEAFDEVRRMFPKRQPLIQIAGVRPLSVQINRAAGSPRKKVETLNFLIWHRADQRLVRGHAPAWVARLRFGFIGIGDIGLDDLHVTMEDIERYAPGVLMDFKTADGDDVLVWTR